MWEGQEWGLLVYVSCDFVEDSENFKYSIAGFIEEVTSSSKPNVETKVRTLYAR